MVEVDVGPVGGSVRVRAISSTSPRATTRHPGRRLGRIGWRRRREPLRAFARSDCARSPHTITVTPDRPATGRLTRALALLLDEINTSPPRLPGDPRPITYRITQT